ncbi:cupin domain-containing protein [Pandoraea commovens]|uniref:Cupin n=1 Tax=Pandoraea commovens TaxID=2508289 RepID=A0A5E4R9T2_9BURK|nr:cupin domain-containing protein [Pandoraea commovens]VVD59292.1 hypothetical protein PCO31010_00016 [Pandoraea commovens]
MTVNIAQPYNVYVRQRTLRKRTAAATALTAAFFLCGPTPGLADGHPKATQVSNTQTGVATETLLMTNTAWDGTPYRPYAVGAPAPTLMRITLAPHTVMDWHTHPAPIVGHLVAGTLIIARAEGGATRTFTAGDTIAELVDVPHRGRTGDTGAELLVFYARDAQQPLSTPAAVQP